MVSPELPKTSVKEDQNSEGTRLEVMLQTNKAVEQLVTKITLAPLEWDRIKDSYFLLAQRLGHPPFKSYVHLTGYYLETHLQNSIATISAENINTYIPDPVPNGAQTEKFTFYRDLNRGSLYVKELHPATDGRMIWHDKAEYDSVMMADGLPVVIEAKVARRQSWAGNQLRKIVNPSSINKKLRPLCEYFNTNAFAYVIFSTPEGIEASERLAQFQDDGGIIAPFHFSYEDFHAGAQALSQDIAPQINIPKIS